MDTPSSKLLPPNHSVVPSCKHTKWCQKKKPKYSRWFSGFAMGSQHVSTSFCVFTLGAPTCRVRRPGNRWQLAGWLISWGKTKRKWMRTEGTPHDFGNLHKLWGWFMEFLRGSSWGYPFWWNFYGIIMETSISYGDPICRIFPTSFWWSVLVGWLMGNMGNVFQYLKGSMIP